MRGLLLHCGANEVDFDQIVATETPLATGSHVPVAHHELVNLAVDQLADNGYEIQGESHSLTRDGARYFGLFQLTFQGRDERDYGLTLGVRNSHDRKFPAAFAVGSRVFVCDNLSFIGDYKIQTKHTRYIWSRLPQVVAGAIGGLGDKWLLQDQRFNAYKNHELSRQEAHDLIIRAAQVGACTPRHAIPIADEYKEPAHPEFKERNLWALFNAFTEKLKGNVHELPKRTRALHAVFDSHIGLLTESDKADAIQI